MDKKGIEKAKEREKRRWDQYDHHDNDHKPINDALEHLNKIEGYPTKKPAKMKSLPLPIRIVGYVLLGLMAMFFLAGLVLNFI